MPNYIVLRLTPPTATNAATFTNWLTGLTVTVSDISYGQPINGVLLGAAPFVPGPPPPFPKPGRRLASGCRRLTIGGYRGHRIRRSCLGWPISIRPATRLLADYYARWGVIQDDATVMHSYSSGWFDGNKQLLGMAPLEKGATPIRTSPKAHCNFRLPSFSACSGTFGVPTLIRRDVSVSTGRLIGGAVSKQPFQSEHRDVRRADAGGHSAAQAAPVFETRLAGG
jgi:hypothetical protein